MVKCKDLGKLSLPFLWVYGRIFFTRGRGVVANMRPCQGRDRGFEPRRSRQSKETFTRGSFLLEDHWFEPRPYRMLRNRSRQSKKSVVKKDLFTTKMSLHPIGKPLPDCDRWFWLCTMPYLHYGSICPTHLPLH